MYWYYGTDVDFVVLLMFDLFRLVTHVESSTTMLHCFLSSSSAEDRRYVNIGSARGASGDPRHRFGHQEITAIYSLFWKLEMSFNETLIPISLAAAQRAGMDSFAATGGVFFASFSS